MRARLWGQIWPSPDHSRITHSRKRRVPRGHRRTRRRRHLSSGGPQRSRQDTRGHGADTVRDREAVRLVRRSGRGATVGVAVSEAAGPPSGLCCTAKKYSQRRRLWPTSADTLSTIPTPADYNRPLARNSKTEGRGFESFRPCHSPCHFVSCRLSCVECRPMPDETCHRLSLCLRSSKSICFMDGGAIA